MKQYCRYCANLVYGDSYYCEVKRRCLSYDGCKRPNKCKDFELNPIDALGENPNDYKPREKRIKVNQQTLFDVKGANNEQAD